MNDKTIEALVQTTIQTQIIQAFNEAPQAIEFLVQSALKQEVDQYGSKPSGYHDKKMPFLEWAVGDTIRRIARGAIDQAVEARRPEIEGAVKAALTAEAVVQAMIDRVLGTLKEDYRVQISFKDDEDKRR